MVDPGLERRGHRVVVHGRADDQAVGGFQLAYQDLGIGQRAARQVGGRPGCPARGHSRHPHGRSCPAAGRPMTRAPGCWRTSRSTMARDRRALSDPSSLGLQSRCRMRFIAASPVPGAWRSAWRWSAGPGGIEALGQRVRQAGIQHQFGAAGASRRFRQRVEQPGAQVAATAGLVGHQVVHIQEAAVDEVLVQPVAGQRQRLARARRRAGDSAGPPWRTRAVKSAGSARCGRSWRMRGSRRAVRLRCPRGGVACRPIAWILVRALARWPARVGTGLHVTVGMAYHIYPRMMFCTGP